ncbi:hypothetical protein HUJ05_000722 [Dendroctonus ponderosae]|nr:hypothetical protein HUJ05_000722 [Dendroctonus ponderosae]
MASSWDDPAVTHDVITNVENSGSFQSEPLDLTMRKEPAIKIDESGTGTYPRKVVSANAVDVEKLQSKAR